jgi:hypothetical protein
MCSTRAPKFDIFSSPAAAAAAAAPVVVFSRHQYCCCCCCARKKGNKKCQISVRGHAPKIDIFSSDVFNTRTEI